MGRTITVTDAVIRSWAANPAIRAEFPFLATPRSTRRPGCCGAAAPISGGDRVKAAIAGLPVSRVVVLKRLVHAATLIVYFREGGRTVDVRV